jgi:hypothetical protein
MLAIFGLFFTCYLQVPGTTGLELSKPQKRREAYKTQVKYFWFFLQLELIEIDKIMNVREIFIILHLITEVYIRMLREKKK